MNDGDLRRSIVDLEARIKMLELAVGTPCGGQKPQNLLSDPGFEESMYARDWSFRVADRAVYRDPTVARTGNQFLAANNARNPSEPQPSIAFTLNGQSNPKKPLITFDIWARNAKPLDRRVSMVLWSQYEPQPTNPGYYVWEQVKSVDYNVTDKWQFLTVAAECGGFFPVKCEVYWNDSNPIDIFFDDASVTAVR